MRFKLIWKFILAYLGIAIISFVLISTIGSNLVMNKVEHIESLKLYNEAKTIVKDMESLSDPLPLVHSKLKAISSYQGTTIWLLTNNGEVILDTSANYDPNKSFILNYFNRVDLGTGYYKIGRFFNYFNDDTMSVLYPFSKNYNVAGYLVIHLPMSSIISLKEDILKTVHAITWATFAVSLFILFLVVFSINHPIRKITAGAKKFAEGDLSYRIGLKTSDEMGYLSDTLDYMAGELEKTGERQKALISNISHDFRSPLTSIKGYAQAIQDGVIPPEMQNKYLGIIVSESDRLNKLSQEVLTLEKVNANSSVFKMAEFNINELIKNVAASFEGRFISKNMTLDLTFEEEELIVYADQTAITQVFQNLIDNAIKFSKNNSSILIETSENFGKAYISVSDHGIGISSSDLPKIFDRFYKTDQSRGRDPKGSGLGLAIVKEIIQAHGQKINAVSTPDVGTTFSFTLPLEAPASN